MRFSIRIAWVVFSVVILFCCDRKEQISSVNPENWNRRIASGALPDSVEEGVTYLSVYSEIFSRTEHITHNLTVTVSVRNTNESDTIYIEDASYFDSHGKHIRSYFDHTIYIGPLETVEIVIDQEDQSGGTGGNFLFDWVVPKGSHEPLFEAVMISTSSQQGLSFTTTGKRVE